MALRDQPYLPLFVQDFLTDEKLAECSAQSTGVYIRIMCLMHKSEEYGKLLLKQKHKQTDNQNKNFALMLARHFPYSVEEIELSIKELLNEKVVYLDGDFLCQKRMIKDYEISVIRSNAGKKGGRNSLGKDTKKEKDFVQAKVKANTENEIEYEYEIENNNIGDGIIFSDINSLKAELHKSEQWLSDVGILYGLKSIENVKKHLYKFLLEQKAKQNLNRSLIDIKQHFTNWLKFNINKPEINSQETYKPPKRENTAIQKPTQKSPEQVEHIMWENICDFWTKFKDDPKPEYYLTFASFDFLFMKKIITEDYINSIELTDLKEFVDYAESRVLVDIKRAKAQVAVIKQPETDEWKKLMITDFISYEPKTGFEIHVYRKVKQNILWRWFKKKVDDKVDFMKMLPIKKTKQLTD